MALSLQRKIVIVLLALYWPTLFVFAHIPIPRVVREADVSDKSLHFLAYLILVYLLWFALRGEQKVNWRGIGPWCMLAALAVYGVLDEWSQSLVAGRSCDIQDFVADMAGTLTGLILFSVFTFWPAGLCVVGIVIFGLTNVTSANLGDLMPVTSGAFHLFAYAIFTLLWVQHKRHSRFGAWPPKTGINRLAVMLAAPVALLLFVKVFSLVFDRAFGVRDMLISAGGIGAALAGVYLTPLFERQEKSKIR
jgi:VanZ family protein